MFEGFSDRGLAHRLLWAAIRSTCPVEPAVDLRLGVSSLVTSLRVALAIDQAEFAGLLGCNRSTVYRLENAQEENVGDKIHARLRDEAAKLGWFRVAEAFESQRLLAVARRNRGYRRRSSPQDWVE